MTHSNETVTAVLTVPLSSDATDRVILQYKILVYVLRVLQYNIQPYTIFLSIRFVLYFLEYKLYLLLTQKCSSVSGHISSNVING